MKFHLLTLPILTTLAFSAFSSPLARPSTLHRSPAADFGFYPGYNNLPGKLDSAHLHPVIRDFQSFIEDNPEIYVGFQQMFEQVPTREPYDMDFPGIGPQVRNYVHMLDRLNKTLGWAPALGHGRDFFPFPLAAMFTYPACTEAGREIFTNPDVNRHFARILKTWSQFLDTPESRYTLTQAEGGWLSPHAIESMPNFVENFVCNPDEEYWGFKSWDDFFTRRFRDGARPVDAPDDDGVVTNACESTPYRVSRNIKEVDTFWIKGEPYSLRHMLNGDPLTSQFVGGTVYQAYLSQSDYHRWHSPVDGTIVKILSVPGTYFALPKISGFDSNSGVAEPLSEGESQPYLSSMATRMLVYIKADNPDIGLMVFMAVGMQDVSSCEATVKEGDRVKKGDQIGMFHFGGSSHVLIFRPETKIEFDGGVQKGLVDQTTRVLLNQCLGVVRSSESDVSWMDVLQRVLSSVGNWLSYPSRF